MVGEVKLLAVTVPLTMRMLVPAPFKAITFCAVVDVETFAQNATDFTDEETLPTVVEAVIPSNLIAWPILPGVLRGAVVVAEPAGIVGVHVPPAVNVHMYLPPDCVNLPPVALVISPVVAEIITMPEPPEPPLVGPSVPPPPPPPLLAVPATPGLLRGAPS